jgi:hypothetical protein
MYDIEDVALCDKVLMDKDFSFFGPMRRNKSHYPIHGISFSSHDDGNKFNYHSVFFGRTSGNGQY